MQHKQTYHYIYIIECLITKRIYVGRHSTKNMNDGYMGSGVLIGRSKNKYGEENHKMEIIDYAEDAITLKELEFFYVDIAKEIYGKMCLDIAPGGDGWLPGDLHPLKGKPLSEAQRKKISEAQMGKKNHMYGKHLSTKQKKLISKHFIDRKWMIKDGIKKQIKPDDIDEYLKDGWDYFQFTGDKNGMFGKIHDDETKLQMKKSANNRWYGEKGEEQRNHLRNIKLGVKRSEECCLKISQTVKCLKWIKKGDECIRVKPEELDKYLEAGWKFGRIMKKFKKRKSK